MPLYWLPLALIASATAFPAMLFERAVPRWPTQDDLSRNMPPLTWRTAYHHLKNITTECVRADAQYFSKLSCFVIAVLAITVSVQMIVQ